MAVAGAERRAHILGARQQVACAMQQIVEIEERRHALLLLEGLDHLSYFGTDQRQEAARGSPLDQAMRLPTGGIQIRRLAVQPIGLCLAAPCFGDDTPFPELAVNR